MEIYESGASEINLAKDAQVFLDGKAVSVVHDGDVHSEWKPVNAQEGGFGLWTWVKPSALSSVKFVVRHRPDEICGSQVGSICRRQQLANPFGRQKALCAS